MSLLQILNNVTNPSIVDRAKNLFTSLLDILASLNSRVSAELSVDYAS